MLQQKELPQAGLGIMRIRSFCSTLKEKLLVTEISVDKIEVRLTSSYAVLAGALAMSTKLGVPSFVSVWLPRRHAQQNFFAYNFSFIMIPINKRHPRSAYQFYRGENSCCGQKRTQ